MSTALQHFDQLSRFGFRIIPLWPNSKVPMVKGWNKHWDHDKVRRKLERFPDANIGLLLGDIIDVEGDDEFANDTINRLVDGYPHPAYESTKSIHHLFRTPDPALRIFRVGNIEFRGYSHQSVLPPSNHRGITYQWRKNFKFPVPEMPEALRVFYLRHKCQDLLKPGHIQVWCAICQSKCFLHNKRFDLELAAFRSLGRKWECQKCRDVDLRHPCRLIKRGKLRNT